MSQEILNLLDNAPNVKRIVERLLYIWPEHSSYCATRFSSDSVEFLSRNNQLASLILSLAGDDLAQFLEDYRWMCERFVEEDLYFHRHGKYRLSTFEDAFNEVYGDNEYMAKYVRGILISQLIWHPHALAFDFFRTDFLTSLPNNAKYLEVGPGHGLFLYFASSIDRVGEIVAWDVSESSIVATKKAIKKLAVTKPVKLVKQDVLKAPTKPNFFDAAVISEVLEHLEAPEVALETLFSSLKEGGKVFINAPINSPAPDHIYLWRSTDEFVEFVKAVGFRVLKAKFLPVTGASLERARKQNLSISCVLVAEKPLSHA